MLGVIILNATMLCVIILNLIMVSVIMLGVVMLRVIIHYTECHYAGCRYSERHYAIGMAICAVLLIKMTVLIQETKCRDNVGFFSYERYFIQLVVPQWHSGRSLDS